MDATPSSSPLSLLLFYALQGLASLMPSAFSAWISPQGIAQILLSLGVFALLCARNMCARGIVALIGRLLFFVRNAHVSVQIQQTLHKPIAMLLLLCSAHIALIILSYPHSIASSMAKWFMIFYISNGAWLLVILSQACAMAYITFAQQERDYFRKEVANLLLKMLDFLIIVIALLWILHILGFNISAIIASLGLGGLAVALAVKDMLANFFASVMLLVDKSFSQGDSIECGGVSGVVVEMGLRRTTIRTGDNALIFIPNADLANKPIINWSRRKVGRLIRFSVGLVYDTPPNKILCCVESIKTMLHNHPLIAHAMPASELESSLALKQHIISPSDYLGYKHAIYVGLDALAPSSINILVYCFSAGVSFEAHLLAKEQITLEILRILDELKLSLAFPSQSIYIESSMKDNEPSISAMKDPILTSR